MRTQEVPNRTKLLYGIGAFGYGSVGQTTSSFLMFFGTGVLGIPGTLMGIAVGIGTMWDATTDPFVGHWSDKTRGRLGKRHGWILFACIAVAITNLMVWSISPAWPLIVKFFMLTLLLLVLETFNTCYSTPYSALGLDLSYNYDDRTAVQNYKTAFNFLSLLVPSFLMTVFLSPTRYASMAQSNRGYIEIAVVTGILCIVCGIICFVGTFKYCQGNVTSSSATNALVVDSNHYRMSSSLYQKSKKEISSIFGDFFSILKEPNVGRLIAGYAVSLSAGAFLTSLGLHVFTYTFGFSTMQIPIIMVCLISGIIFGQPIWYMVSRRTDKTTALVYSLATLIVTMVVFGIILTFRTSISSNIALVFVSMTIFASGIGTGCLYSLPISMFADCISRINRLSGTDKTGKSAGFLTFCTKISNAVIMFAIGLSLDLIGFRGGDTVQTVSTQNWLGWLLIAGVMTTAFIAILIYGKYSYTKKDFIST